MSFLSVSKDGYLLAEDSQQAFIDESMRVYREAKKEIDALLKDSYAKLAGISKDKYWAEMVKYNRYEGLAIAIEDLYKSASLSAGKSTVGGLTAAMEDNYNRQQYISDWVAPDAKVIPISPELVRFSVTGNVDIWKKIQTDAFARIWGDPILYSPQAGTLTDLLTKNRNQELDQILQSLQNGFVTGKSYTAQSKSINSIIGTYLKSTDEATGAMYKSLRIARSEGNRVLNAASLANGHQLESQGIPVEKRWSASLDSSTRSSHGAEDGDMVALDSNFTLSSGSSGKAPGQMSIASDNINCRCHSINVINGVNPQVRTARNPVTGETDAISFQSYTEWMEEYNL